MSTALARNYSKTDAMKIANQLKSKIRNSEMNKEKVTRRLSALTFGAVSAGGMGFAMGKLARKAAQDGTAGTEKDPRKLGPIPLPLLVGGVASGIGLVAGGLTKSKKLAWVNDAIEAAGSHIVAGYAYQKAYEEGQK